LGGVPATVLSDRTGCLKGATVAGLVVPTADYVRFAKPSTAVWPTTPSAGSSSRSSKPTSS
ncbi:MAG: hypothetical protein M3488_13245, partial [Actinomycetota bacterium]|nr:hypothetical protein [Actinomycetota bacterium]